MAPSSTRPTFCELSPRFMNHPSPPAPAKAAIVIVPTAATAEMRMPAIMKGAASGSSIRNIRCHFVSPMPRATSIVFGSMLMMPV